MTPQEFRTIRHRLGLTQAELAGLLGYALPLQVSELERKTNPKPVPRYLDLVMEALDVGFWPRAWPPRKVQDESAADAGTGGQGTGDRRGHAGSDAQGRRHPVRQHRPRTEA
jgi:transcriptional regulator with XRE-family HTH domain